MTYYAHSLENRPLEEWESVKTHLTNVAEKARIFGSDFQSGELAHLCGLLHDLGKYEPEFQRRILGEKIRHDHSTAGAYFMSQQLGKPFASIIAGHHCGLANLIKDGDKLALETRLSTPNIASRTEKAMKAFREDGLIFQKPTASPLKITTPFGMMLYIRMLFSCLIDADRLETERFYEEKDRVIDVNFTDMAEKLQKHIDTMPKAKSELNAIRADILANTLEKANEPQGLFSLTVPTGGGKTLASLAFALKHAQKHGLKRVIFVVPYTSIIEQTADIYRKILGDEVVLEHHSALDDERLDKDELTQERAAKMRLAGENFDAPVIITTAVQFFESLFTDHPSKSRKLHNFSKSVIVFDEVQTLPLGLLDACVLTIQELALNYGSSLVLCTATQPSLLKPDFKRGLTNLREIIPDVDRLFTALKRVSVVNMGKISDETLLTALKNTMQGLVIVNSRKHAITLFKALGSDEANFYLTTYMCAEHRSNTINIIKMRLKNKQPCRVIATSLVEAGVDFSFQTVWRAAAGLDNVAQAAGRCNREGLFPLSESTTYIFEPEAGNHDPDNRASIMAETLRHNKEDPLSPPVIANYFKRLYAGNNTDAKNIITLSATNYPFETIAKAFKMIEEEKYTLIIPYDDKAKAALEALKNAGFPSKIARQLQRYTVGLRKNEYDVLLKYSAVEYREEAKFGTRFLVLENMKCYSDKQGLDIEGLFPDAEGLMY